MLFFGFYFLFAKTPEKAIFENYLRSRRIMGGGNLATCGQLFRTFAFRNQVRECQCGHTDEPVHLFPLLLAVQFGTYDAARPFLYHAEAVADPPEHVVTVLHNLRGDIVFIA